MALYECRKCGRSFEELQLWGRVEHHGDHWKCTSCDCDITKNLEQWLKEVQEAEDFFRLVDSMSAP